MPPLLKATKMLHELGDRLLLSVLRRERLPDLASLLSVKETPLLVQPSIWEEMTYRQRVAYFVQRVKKGFLRLFRRSTAHFQYRDLMARAIAGSLSSEEWRVRTIALIKEELGAVSPHAVPDELWLVVSEMAWRDLNFQHQMATRIRDNLRERVLFTFGDMPTPTLSPNTFWILLALAAAQPPAKRAKRRRWPIFSRIADILSRFRWWNALKRLLASPEQRLIRRATERLQNEAQQQSLDHNWAGFWDQWIISETLQQWPNALQKLDPPLRNALTALPLLNITSPPASQDTDKESAEQSGMVLATREWEEELPGWFESLCRQ